MQLEGGGGLAALEYSSGGPGILFTGADEGITQARTGQLSLVQPVVRPWLVAAEAGKRGERCGASYRYCGDTHYGDKLRLQLATW